MKSVAELFFSNTKKTPLNLDCNLGGIEFKIHAEGRSKISKKKIQTLHCAVAAFCEGVNFTDVSFGID